jgi:hypothetical protein
MCVSAADARRNPGRFRNPQLAFFADLFLAGAFFAGVLFAKPFLATDFFAAEFIAGAFSLRPSELAPERLARLRSTLCRRASAAALLGQRLKVVLGQHDGGPALRVRLVDVLVLHDLAAHLAAALGVAAGSRINGSAHIPARSPRPADAPCEVAPEARSAATGTPSY